VALVHRPKYDDWSFPKGKLDPGEHVLLAAVREVAEETALQVTLGRRLPPVRYASDGEPKRVDYWVATVAGALSAFEPTSEIDDVAWLAASQAGTRLSYERDMQTLADFRAGPLQTVPLILVRHASAGSKSDWPNSDASRPLDSRGTKDALSLASLLRCFGEGQVRVVSAPAERCVATVRPYVAAVGGVIEIESAFGVGASRAGGASRADGASRSGRSDSAGSPGSGPGGPGGPRRPGSHAGSAGSADASAAAMARLVADSRPVVICAHRENLPILLDAACAALRARSPAGKPLRKGEFAVLHRAAGTLVAFERYDPDGDC
jgi:8-oxo-dGTP diphosphatase